MRHAQSKNTPIRQTPIMEQEKPKTVSDYRQWLAKHHKVKLTTADRNYYESVLTKVRSSFVASVFWKNLAIELPEWNAEYLTRSGYHLVRNNDAPQVELKPYDSYILKTFRKNVIDNKGWPEAPEDGWCFPNQGFSRIHDLVRTLIEVKYLDGVQFIISKMVKLAEKSELAPPVVSFEAREEGYYAAHLNISETYEVPKPDWDTVKLPFVIEVQVTTQLQEVIRKLLHKYYEQRRKAIQEDDTKWQWNYRSDEFAANYLGHILHYVEGMIAELKGKAQMEEEDETRLS